MKTEVTIEKERERLKREFNKEKNIFTKEEILIGIMWLEWVLDERTADKDT